MFYKTQVTIFSGDKLCGGTLIDPKHIVTSAKCINGFLEQFHIKTVPSMSVEVVASGDDHEVNTFRILSLNSNFKDDDFHPRSDAIGLLELVKPVTNNINYSRTKLSEVDLESLTDEEVLVLSSKNMSSGGIKGRRFVNTNLPMKIVSTEECKEYNSLMSHVDDSLTLSCGITKKQDYQLSKGDPVTQGDTLIGVVEEWALGKPIIFTSISKFIQLIQENKQNALSCDTPSCYKVNHIAGNKSLNCSDGEDPDDGSRQCLVNL
ncbi:hypothetical protein QAD02_006595 [Eretmocerus hayati]|uniref:Uncharacterized protein n=1 Tax=Eretmocerus hayati TaxID=131215 RepID=A0ACC2N1S1_9HYME|nr:hypothetical protein QAD02_006595 [Eretmocerus hayati]